MTSVEATAVEQTSLARAVSVRGRGLHTGLDARVTLEPAACGSGRTFVVGGRRIPALAEFVSSTRRCTSLRKDDAEVHTVEHVLGAAFGMLVDNVDIVIDGPELPILDGSATPWVEAIAGAGVVRQGASAQVIALDRPVTVHEGGAWLVAAPAERFSLTCVTVFDHPMLGTQAHTYAGGVDAFASDVAPARTFGFAEEVEALLAQGLAQGASLQNALVVYQDRLSDAQRVPQECLKHKMLDLFGDLALAGARIQAAVFALMPGHRVNALFAACLAERAGRVPAAGPIQAG